MEKSVVTAPSDDAFDALGHVQRRKLLIALLERDSQSDSSVVLADSAAGSDAIERQVAMDQEYLPRLAEYGFIDWNRETQEVLKGPNFDEIRPLLELLANRTDEPPPGRW